MRYISNFLIFVLLFGVSEVGQASSTFTYVDIAYGQPDLVVIYSEKTKLVGLSDIVISDDLGAPPDHGDVYLRVPDLGIDFFVPSKFRDGVTFWNHGACSYFVGNQWFHSYESGKSTQTSIIQAKCLIGQEVTYSRYIYSPVLGLQTIAIGELKISDKNGEEFIVRRAFSLFDSRIGFGALEGSK